MKKLSALLLTLTMLLTAACAKKSNNGNSGTSEQMLQNISVVQTLYKESKIDIGEEARNSISLQKCSDGYYYFYEDSQLELKLVKIDNNFAASQPISLGRSLSKGWGITVHDDGSFTLLSPVTDYELEYDEYGNIANYTEFTRNGSVSFTLTDYDSYGSKTAENEVIGLNEYFDFRQSYLSDMVPYDEGKYIVSLGCGAAVIDTEGNVLDGQIYEQQLVDFGLDTNGKVIISEDHNYAYMDDEGLNFPTELYTEDVFLHLNSEAVTGDMGFKAFFSKDDGIYGLTENEELILVVDFRGSLINSSDVQNFIFCGDGQFLTAGYDSSTLKLYTRRPDDYKDNKQVVDVWQIYNGQGDDLAVEFNKQNDDYLVKMDTNLKSLDELSKAILTGESPDLIFYCNRTVLDGVINMGAAADLYPLMENYDGVKPDDLMPNVLEAFDMDGKLYAIPEYFNVSLCYANSEVIGKEYRDWTFEDMYELYNNRPQGMSFAAELINADLFNTLIVDYQTPWIDVEKNICNFDSDEFIELLKFCRNTTDPAAFEYGYNGIESIKDKSVCMSDKKAMVDFTVFGGFGLAQLTNSIGQKGLTFGDATLLNMPNSGGVGRINCDHCYTVLNTGDCPEGAWAFVSYLLSDERQVEEEKRISGGEKHISGGPNWTNKKAFELSLQNMIHTDDTPRMSKASFANEGSTVFEIEYQRSVSAEQAEEYRDFVMNCTKLKYENDDLNSILWDEYSRFVNDEITAEECAKCIQSRVEIMLSEQA